VDENIYEISRRKAEMISDILDHQNGREEEEGEEDENSDKNQSLISNILTDALNKLIQQQQKGEGNREQQSEEERVKELKRSTDRETPNSPSLIFQSISPNEEEEVEEIL